MAVVYVVHCWTSSSNKLDGLIRKIDRWQVNWIEGWMEDGSSVDKFIRSVISRDMSDKRVK